MLASFCSRFRRRKAAPSTTTPTDELKPSPSLASSSNRPPNAAVGDIAAEVSIWVDDDADAKSDQQQQKEEEEEESPPQPPKPLPPPPMMRGVQLASASFHVGTHGPIPPASGAGVMKSGSKRSMSLRIPDVGLSRIRTGRKDRHHESASASAAEDSIWKKTIILGEKCRVDDDDEDKGNRLISYHPKTPRSASHVSRTCSSSTNLHGSRRSSAGELTERASPP